MSGLNLTLKIWRQKDAKTKGQFETVKINDVSPDMSFLEMLDIVNEEQMKQGKEGFAFDHDCREGICGMCSLVINGMPHGPDHATTTCQLHMRKFKDGDTIVIEPWRAAAFPVIRDCAVDRTAFDHDGVAILELTHVKLAGGGRMVGTVRHTVDDQRAHTANTFAAVVVEGKAFLALLHLFFVHDVQHFEEGHIGRNVVDLDSFELSLGLGILLAPNFQCQIQSAHYL